MVPVAALLGAQNYKASTGFSSPNIYQQLFSLHHPLESTFLANCHLLQHLLRNLILSAFNIPKVLKSAAKIMEISSKIKIKHPKIIWTRSIYIVKMLPKKVTIFPEKNKISNFSL